MDGDADLRGRQVEEAAGFDDLEALVHHGGGVDGDALAHDPGGMFERLCGVMWSKSASGVLRKGPPEAVSQICLTSAGVPPRMALVDGVVLGVDGEQGYVVFLRGGDDEFAGGDEALLVGEADGFAGADGGVGGFESGDADDGGDDEVDFGKRGDVDGSGGAVDDFDAGDACGLEAGLELGGEFFGGDGDDFRTPADALVEGGVEVLACGEGDDLIAVGEGFADGEGAVADGAGGAEDGELFHELYFRRFRIMSLLRTCPCRRCL